MLLVKNSSGLILNFAGLRLLSSIQEENIPVVKKSPTYFFRQHSLCKGLHLHLDSHQQAIVKAGVVFKDLQPWFSNYLENDSKSDCASVAVHLRFRGYRKSIADPNVLNKDIQEFEKATHIVKEVLYGVNALLIIEQSLGDTANREVVEDELFLAVRSLVEEEVIPECLSSANCQFYCDVISINPIIGKFSQCWCKIKKQLVRMEDPQMHIPVEATGTLLRNDFIDLSLRQDQRLVDASLIFTMLQQIMPDFRNSCIRLLEAPIVQRIHGMHIYLEQFINCLKMLSEAIKSGLTRCRSLKVDESVTCLSQLWSNYFANGSLAAWIIQRKNGLEIITKLLSDNNLELLDMSNLIKIASKNQEPTVRFKAFVLKTFTKRDKVMEQLRKDFQQQEYAELSTLEIVTKTEHEVNTIREKLMTFVEKHCNDQLVRCFLTTSSEHETGTILTFDETSSKYVVEKIVITPPADADEGLVESDDDELTIRGTRLLTKGMPSIYLLDSIKRSDTEDLRWFELGVKSTNCQHKVIVLMGASESGKSTLVESMINYILGVQWPDPFRFQVDPGGSKTAITVYTIHHVEKVMKIPFSVTIIDTPGYTGDVNKDQKITSLISNFLTNNKSFTALKSIDAVGLVMKTTKKCSNSKQENALNAALGIFGPSLSRKVVFFCTFCYNLKKSPSVLETIPPLSLPTDSYIKFNNCALFHQKRSRMICESECDYLLPQRYWEMGWASFRALFTRLSEKSSASVPNMQHIRPAQKRQRENEDDEKYSLLKSLKILYNKIVVALERLENLYVEHPYLSPADSWIKLENGDENECRKQTYCKELLDLLQKIAEVAHSLKMLDPSIRYVRGVKFAKDGKPCAADYIQYLLSGSHQSATRLRILTQLLSVAKQSYYIYQDISSSIPRVETITVKQERDIT